MTVPNKYPKISDRLALIISIASIATVAICAFLVGFRYETKKLKALLATIALILAYHFFFADVILMLASAFNDAYYLRTPLTGGVNPRFVGGPDRKEYLRRRINALKAQLNLGPTFYKRNEAMTMKYKRILNDMILFGSYFVLLIVLSIGMRDTLMYYNTRTIKDILTHPKFSSHAASTIVTADDLYKFINGTIIQGFIEGHSYNDQPFNEAGWTYQQIAKVLGVVRLRQIRHKERSDSSSFDKSNYGPAWIPYNPELQYKDKFWRIFQPWMYQSVEQTGAVKKSGKLYSLPGGGYVALLGRNSENSYRVLDFLHENGWIDGKTAVVMIEFTLYSVDADVFTLVVISAEQTAFDTFVVTVLVNTLKLLFNVDNLPWYVLLTFVFYFLVLMRVVAYVILKAWYSPSTRDYLSTSWNYVDMTIIALNIAIVLFVWIREVYVKRLLQKLETSKKNEFVSFYRAADIDETCTVLVAFLVALTTMRLWKILQFARVFRVLTNTLHTAKKPLLSTTYFVTVFIVGIGLGSFIINGSNSEHFSQIFSSIASLLSMSFGFTVSVKPSDLNYGGGPIGFAMYLILVISVTIFLLNMFITVLCLHFTQSKEDDLENSKDADDYSFWHFLVMEIQESLQKRPRNYTKEEKKDGEGDTLRLRGGGSLFGKPKVNNEPDVERERRMSLIAEILDTQMEFLHETLNASKQDDLEGSDEESHIPQEELETVKSSIDEAECPGVSAKNHNKEQRLEKGKKPTDVQPKPSSSAIRSF